MGAIMDTDLSISLQNYLEAIYETIQTRRVARPKDIAAHLNVRMPSVTGALKALSERDMIEHEPYGAIHLTTKGAEAAAKLDRTHEVLRSFLHQVLSIPLSEADETACKVEHVISDNALNRLISFLRFVEHCPQFNVSWHDDIGFLCGKERNGTPCGNCPGPLSRKTP